MDKPESHIRAFAGETLSAVVALGAFADAVVKPLGLLPEFTACFDMLRNIVDILQKGEGAFLKMEVLKKAMFFFASGYRGGSTTLCRFFFQDIRLTVIWVSRLLVAYAGNPLGNLDDTSEKECRGDCNNNPKCKHIT